MPINKPKRRSPTNRVTTKKNSPTTVTGSATGMPAIKTSLGACDTIPWEQVKTVDEIINQLQQEGFVVAAVELHDKAISLGAFELPEQVVYIVGNEVTGVEESTIEQSDVVIQLPMLGQKESLNVATTAGIVMYYGLV